MINSFIVAPAEGSWKIVNIYTRKAKMRKFIASDKREKIQEEKWHQEECEEVLHITVDLFENENEN